METTGWMLQMVILAVLRNQNESLDSVNIAMALAEEIMGLFISSAIESVCF
jgi:hypothetical protein